MAERKRANVDGIPPQVYEMPEGMSAMFGLLGMMQQIREIHEGMGAVIGLLEKIVKQMEQPKPPPAPVASPAQMYPTLHGAPIVPTEEPEADAPAPRRPVGWWGRAFPTRERHE
jgi:hypothetical protein